MLASNSSDRTIKIWRLV
ncbi:hypothetical protein [Nostoc sp. C117]